MKSFHDFMFATSPGSSNRFQYLHSIEWADPRGFQRTMATHDQARFFNLRFMLVISYSISLRKLVIRDGGRFELPRVKGNDFAIELLASHPGLNEVELHNVPIRFLEQTKAPIKKLILRGEKWPFEIMSSIAHLSETLISLEVADFQLPPQQSTVQFPHIRHLHINRFRRDTSFVAPTMFRVFPNLKYLCLQDAPNYCHSSFLITENSIVDQHYRVYHASSMEWKHLASSFSLKKLTGNPEDLLRGAYQCPVEDLVIDGLYPTNASFLLPLLPSIRPRCLTLALRVRYDGDGCWERTPVETLKPILQIASSHGNLKVLSLILDEIGRINIESMVVRCTTIAMNAFVLINKPLQANIPTLLSHVRLESFSVRITKLRPHFGEGPIVYSKPTLNIPGFARGVVLVQQSLRTLTIWLQEKTYNFHFPRDFRPDADVSSQSLLSYMVIS